MARRIFFSFHYDDVLRTNVVRKSDVVARRYAKATRFTDRGLWEAAKKQGDLAIKRMINGALDGSSVTCVLIGQQTWARPWVRYELLKSFERGNGIFGVQIHDVGMERGGSLLTGALSGSRPRAASLLGGALGQNEPAPGGNPFQWLGFRVDYNRRRLTLLDYVNFAWRAHPHFEAMALSDVRHPIAGEDAGTFERLFPVYSWKNANGYQNFPNWAEAAARQARR